MKRKMIVEQLLLLLLRILLMILIGLLLARFLGFDLSGQEARSTHHLVLIDDSPSMADAYKGDDGVQTDAFEQGKRVLIEQIAPTAAQATTPQSLEVMRMSDTAAPKNFERLHSGSGEEIKKELDTHAPTTVRTELSVALKAAQEQILKAGGADTARVLHVMSDHRSNDWAENGPAIQQILDELAKAKVKVHFVDTAYPYRKAEKRVPLFSDNVGVVDFSPSQTVVAQREAVEFTLKVRNFGTSELKDVRFSIRVNGDENKGKSEPIASLPPGQVVTKKFDLTFDLDKDAAENPFKRFQIVSAVMETGEPGGLAIDNSRHTVVEVRRKLPILVIDGQPTLRDTRAGSSIYLKGHFQANGSGYQWTPGVAADLEKGDLGQYSFVLLLNAPGLTEPARKALEKYAENGGGVGFFLGPDVKPVDYNKELHRDGAGIFPVPLPNAPSKELTEKELEDKKFSIFQKKILLRDPAMRFHPALEGIYINKSGLYDPKEVEQLEKYYRFVTINRYWPVARIGKWRQDKSVSELYCMPNDQPRADFEGAAIAAAKKLLEAAVDDGFSKFKKPLTELGSKIEPTVRSAGDLSDLAGLFDRLLVDQISEGDADEALLREFWSLPKVADLKAEFVRLRDAMKFGDPLYMAKRFGRGRVAVMFTTAGEAWSDWPSGQGNASFSPMIMELTKYLSGGGADDNRSCGQTVKIPLDPEGYAAKARYAFLSHDGKPGGGRQLPGVLSDPAPLAVGDKEEALDVERIEEKSTVKEGDKDVEKTTVRDVLVAKLRDTRAPGIHLVELTQQRANPNNPAEKVEVKEYRALPVNVDAAREGDLMRASGDDIAQHSPGVDLHAPDDTDWIDKLKNKKTDLTELGWLFLAFLLVLLAEQAMAVRLSYHANSEGLVGQAPSAAQAMRKSTAPQDVIEG